MSSQVTVGTLTVDNSLAEDRWVRGAKSKAEILHCDAKGIQNLHIDYVFVKVNKIHLLTDLLHGGFQAEGRNI
jgi:hypothetical protein